MKRTLLTSLLLFFLIHGKAEKLISLSDIYETPFTSQAVAWLERGAEVWLAEDQDERRIKIYTKLWVKRKDMNRGGIAKPGAALYNSDGQKVGGIYKELNTIYDTTSSFSSYALIFRGYIGKDRIDPKSIPETELAKILDPKKSKVDTSDMNPFLAYFSFRQVQDTMGFVMYEMRGQDGPRMSLAFRDNRLVAVIPTQGLRLKFYEAELSQAELRVIYLEKLLPDEEELFATFFAER